MKELVLWTVCTIALLVAVDVSADRCASFDFDSNMLHVPCVLYQGESYWVDMRLLSSNLVFELADAGPYEGSYEPMGADAGCAVVDDYMTKMLQIPCLRVGEKEYYLNMLPLNKVPVQLWLAEYHENVCSNEGKTFSTYLMVMDRHGNETRTFKSGDQIIFQLVYRNLRCTEQEMSYASAPANFLATNDAGVNLWWQWPDWNPCWNEGCGFFKSVLRFEANETKVFTISWDQKDYNGHMVPTGRYRFQGFPDGDIFIKSPSETRSEVVDIQIE